MRSALPCVAVWSCCCSRWLCLSFWPTQPPTLCAHLLPCGMPAFPFFLLNSCAGFPATCSRCTTACRGSTATAQQPYSSCRRELTACPQPLLLSAPAAQQLRRCHRDQQSTTCCRAFFSRQPAATLQQTRHMLASARLARARACSCVVASTGFGSQWTP